MFPISLDADKSIFSLNARLRPKHIEVPDFQVLEMNITAKIKLMKFGFHSGRGSSVLENWYDLSLWEDWESEDALSSWEKRIPIFQH